MSIIGTRPPLISETNFYELHHRARLAIKPGITGMWQVSGRSDITDFEEVVRLDKEYITDEYDILLFPTHWNTEGVPGILVEAKMAGVAVIASDRSYNSELIQVDKNEGVVIHQPYFSEMYKYIKKMYFDREYLQKIKEGSSQSRKRYALEEYKDMIQKLFGGGEQV